jgi:uncharacterized Tic20 family protein
MNSFTKPTTEERIWAAVAHGSVLFFFLGPIVSILVWVTQRRKSKYASFQALQALGFQIGSFWLWMLFAILMPFVLLAVSILIVVFMAESDFDADLLGMGMSVGIMVLVFGLWGIVGLEGLVAAIACALGHEYRYPILGRRLENHLASGDESALDETKEDCWVAAMGHAGGIFLIFGAILPLLAWFTQKERSACLRFQALQAAAFQGIATVLYFVGYILYMLAYFAMMVVMFLGMAFFENSQAGGAVVGIAMILFLLVMGLFSLAYLVLGPLYLVFLAIATVKTARGEEYRLPLLGKWLARRLEASTVPVPDVPLPESNLV